MPEPQLSREPTDTVRRARPRGRALIGALVLGSALGAVLLVAVAAEGSGSVVRGSGRLAWIVNLAAARGVAERDSGLAQHFFDAPATFITASRGQTLPEPRATRTASFASEAALQAAVDGGRLAPGTRAVVYDSEDWPATPLAEQQNLAKYYRLAAGAAHRHRLRLIATPAADLVKRLDPSARPGTEYAAFVRLRIAAKAARYADVYEIQAQGSEMALPKYVSFVRAVAAQARQTHPGIEVLAGISTGPGGVRQTASVLFDAVRATRRLVSGYWLNDPAGGSACPKCTGPYPEVAVELLRRLRASRD